MTTTPTPTLSGRDIGDAARATRAVLDTVLARAEASFFDWAVLFTVASHAEAVPEDTLVSVIRPGVPRDDPSIRSGIAELETTGYLRRKAPVAAGPVGDRLELTGTGAARFEELREAVDEATTQLYDGIPWSDLATTRYVLEEVTQRANVLVRRAQEANA